MWSYLRWISVYPLTPVIYFQAHAKLHWYHALTLVTSVPNKYCFHIIYCISLNPCLLLISSLGKLRIQFNGVTCTIIVAITVDTRTVSGSRGRLYFRVDTIPLSQIISAGTIWGCVLFKKIWYTLTVFQQHTCIFPYNYMCVRSSMLSPPPWFDSCSRKLSRLSVYVLCIITCIQRKIGRIHDMYVWVWTTRLSLSDAHDEQLLLFQLFTYV